MGPRNMPIGLIMSLAEPEVVHAQGDTLGGQARDNYTGVTSWTFPRAHTGLQTIRALISWQGPANTFIKGPDKKYFKFCGSQMVSVTSSSFFFLKLPFKDGKIIFTSQAFQSQSMSWIWSTGYGLLCFELDCRPPLWAPEYSVQTKEGRTLVITLK